MGGVGSCMNLLLLSYTICAACKIENTNHSSQMNVLMVSPCMQTM